MKQYILQEEYRGIPQGTELFGPYLITGGGQGYFEKENIPAGPEGGTQCIFESAILSNPLIFKEVVNSKP
jgi:hypothetical protein